MSIWDKLTKIVLALVVIALLMLIGLWYVPLIQQNERMRQEILRLESNLELEKEINRQLQRAIEAQRNDPKTVERLARENLGLAKPGETVIRFEEPSTNAPAVTP
jgi:cell division protein FtsB